MYCYAYILLQCEILALGACVGLDPKGESFALGADPPPTQLKSPPTQRKSLCTQRESQCESVEYRSRWVPSHWGLRWVCTFHVFVLISFRLSSQREPSFQWNMDFTDLYRWVFCPQTGLNLSMSISILNPRTLFIFLSINKYKCT